MKQPFSNTGYKVKQKRQLDHWAGILEEWILATERYCRVCGGYDAPYFYTEQANVGLLSAAVWRSGGISLTEFQSEKGAKHRPKWGGRVDLWLQAGNIEQVLEAKLLNISMHANREINDVIAQSMDAALKDAKATRGNSDADALGAVFVIPHIAVSRVGSLDNFEEQIEAFIENILQENNYHAAAWCFPKEMRYDLEDPFKDGYLYPGVMMLVRNQKH